MRFSHSISTMMNFCEDNKRLFDALPEQFSKKQFEAIRKSVGGHPMTIKSAEKYGYVEVCRTEATTYTTLESVWTDRDGHRYTFEEMITIHKDVRRIIFNSPDHEFVYDLPYTDIEVEHPCERYIYKLTKK